MTDILVQHASNEADDLSLAAAMKSVREGKQISARALSLKAGLSQAYVGKVEKGQIEPSLRAFACIVQKLGLSPREVHLLVMREAQRAERDALAVSPDAYVGEA